MTDQSTRFPVYFGYSDAAKYPEESISGVRQVILAMSDLLYNYRDPNDLGENPDGDTRSGIRFIFEACAMQLEAAVRGIADQKSEAETLRTIPGDFSFDRLDPADKLVVACRLNGLKYDTIREGIEAAQGKQDYDLRLRFDSIATRDMSDAAKAKISITEPVDPGRKQQSA